MKTITIKNDTIQVELITTGATVKRILLPDENGQLENIVLTHKENDTYKTNPGYFGCTVGRTSGRIKDSKFELNGVEYQINSSTHGLHGGDNGFEYQEFEIEEQTESKVVFSYFSQNMEAGYPGNLKVIVSYTLTKTNDLIVDYYGITDQDTLLNLTHHSYFNLSGAKKEKVLNHYLQIESDYVLETVDMVPTGKYLDVTDTLFDFRKSRKIGSIYDYKEYSEDFRGLDDTWILNGPVIYHDPKTKRTLTVTSDYPALVSYIFNYPEDQILEDDSIAQMHTGIAFECQFEPNGVNTSNLNQSILKAGEIYQKQIKYSFEMR